MQEKWIVTQNIDSDPKYGLMMQEKWIVTQNMDDGRGGGDVMLP